jgi:hypothetical protein
MQNAYPPKTVHNTVILTESSLLNRGGLAERWGCSIETIKRRERAGVLNAIILGRLVRYRLSDILSIEAAAAVKGVR